MTASAHSSAFLKLVMDAKSRIRETDVATIRQRLANHEKFVLIDVREDNEWDKGAIPTAIHMGKGVIERDIEKTIPDTNTEIVLYCGGGYRSALAADALQKMGYRNVLSMDGGYKGWVSG